jgi:hypothetical protein
MSEQEKDLEATEAEKTETEQDDTPDVEGHSFTKFEGGADSKFSKFSKFDADKN